MKRSLISWAMDDWANFAVPIRKRCNMLQSLMASLVWQNGIPELRHIRNFL